MSFYYISIFSLIPLAIAYAVLIVVFAFLGYLTRGAPGRKTILGGVGAIFLLLPVSEELWIAWNFGRACKQAGTFIHKQVQADGFYDASGGGALELVQSGGYQFIESRTRRGVTRITAGDEQFLKEAIQRFAEANTGRDPWKEDVLRVSFDAQTEALVYPKKAASWKVTQLNAPTARYHYASSHHTHVMHKVVKHEAMVSDTSTKEILGTELKYGRKEPWFFVGLDAPVKLCAGSRDVKGMLYENVLLPTPAKAPQR